MKILISIEIDSFEELARVGSVLAQANVNGKVEFGGVGGHDVDRAPPLPTNHPAMAQAATQAPPASKPALASVPLPATPPRATAPAPKDADLKGVRTMQAVIVAVTKQGAKTLAEVLEKCRALKAAELVPVLNVIADEDLEDRVTTACESLGVG